MRIEQSAINICQVQELKIGQRTSTISISLYQNAIEKVTGFLTNSNLDTETGLSLPTNWSLNPPPPVVVGFAGLLRMHDTLTLHKDFSKLDDNTDPNWERIDQLPLAEFRKASKNLTFWLNRVKTPRVAIVDEWIRMKNNERFHLRSLGLVNDMFPSMCNQN